VKTFFLCLLILFKIPAHAITKTPPAIKPGTKDIQKLNVRVRVRDVQSDFEMQRQETRTVVVMKSQLGRKYTLLSPKRDFDDLSKILLHPATNSKNCQHATIEVESHSSKGPGARVVDCFEGSTLSSKEKTRTLKMLAVLTAM
jgi:hypothetical protein